MMTAANKNVSLLEALRQMGVDRDADFLRDSARLLAQSLIELEATEMIGADRYERTPERCTSRNGYRDRQWDTRVGKLDLKIPKVREGTFFPSFLEPRRMTEKAIVSVVQEAYVHGVSTRKVDDLVRALGLDGIDKSEVSRIAKELDDQVNLFLSRPLEGPYPYVWLDATYLKVRHDHRVVSKALVIALGVKMTGEREILGFAVGPCESEPFWREFLKGLVARGLCEVKLVISDAHEGLKKAIREVLLEASWQRCTVHFMRNALAHVPRAAQQMVAAYIRTIFAQPDHTTAKAQLGQVGASLEGRFPRVAQMLYECEEDILAYMAFPKEHHRQIHSTNPLERVCRMDLPMMLLWKRHVRQDVLFALVEHLCNPGKPAFQTSPDLSELGFGRCMIGLGEDRPDVGCNHLLSCSGHMGQRIAHEMHRTPLP